MTYTVDLESRSPVGSSNRMIAGEFANDLAIALNKMYYTLFAANHLTTSLVSDPLVTIVLLFLRAFWFVISFIFHSFSLGYA